MCCRMRAVTWPNGSSVDEVRPCGPALSNIDPVGLGGGESHGHFVFDRRFHLAEHGVDFAQVVAKRVAVAERNPGRAGAQLAHGGDVVGPEIVECREPDQRLERQRSAGELVRTPRAGRASRGAGLR